MAAISCCDFIIVNFVFYIAFIVLGKNIPDYFHTYTRIVVVLTNVAILIGEIFFRSIVHFRLLRLIDVSVNVFRLTLTFTISLAVLMKLIFNNTPLHFLLFFSLVSYALLMVSRICERSLVNRLRRQGRNVRRVLFIGDDPALLTLYKEMTDNPEMGYRSLGYYSDTAIKGSTDDFHYLGTLSQLNQMMQENNRSLLKQSGIDIVYCSLPHEMGSEIERIIRSCDKNVVYFYYVPRTFSGSNIRLRPIRIGDHVFFTNHSSALMQPYNKALKRTFDLAVSSVACLFLIPLTLVVGTIIKYKVPDPSSSNSSARVSTAIPSGAISSARCTSTRMPTANRPPRTIPASFPSATSSGNTTSTNCHSSSMYSSAT